MARMLLILNDPPHGTERSSNGLRQAGALSKREGEQVKLFLFGDAASCAKKDQKVPQGYYKVEVMLRNVGRYGGDIGVCATCMDARGVGEAADRDHAPQFARRIGQLGAMGRSHARLLTMA